MGCDIGFTELVASGEIATLPRLFAVQPANCSPIVSAFHGEDGDAPTATVAEGTAIARPVRQDEVIAALRHTGGSALRATEEEITAATLELAGMGLYVEPTCAQAAAAYHQLLKAGTITAEQTTVVRRRMFGARVCRRHWLMGCVLASCRWC
jgi:threonine synthase